MHNERQSNRLCPGLSAGVGGADGRGILSREEDRAGGGAPGRNEIKAEAKVKFGDLPGEGGSGKGPDSRWMDLHVCKGQRWKRETSTDLGVQHR